MRLHIWLLWLRNAIPAVCVAFAMVAPAFAEKSADTLRITWREAIPDVDPYYNSQRTGMVVAFQAFACLVYRDPLTMEIEPALAASLSFMIFPRGQTSKYAREGKTS